MERKVSYIMNLNLHFCNGQAITLKMPVLDDKKLEAIFSSKQPSTALIIHGKNMTALIPRNQLVYADYQHTSANQGPDDLSDVSPDEELPF